MTDNNWIEWKWTPEKPYPETLETRVRVKYKNNTEGLCNVSLLHSDNFEFSNWFDHNDDDTVIAYKVVKGHTTLTPAVKADLASI